MLAIFSVTSILGIILLIAGLAVRYWVNRRKFNRRNFVGLETFNSYEHHVGATFLEKVIKIVGLILVLAGLFFIWVEWFNHHSAEKYRKQKEGVAVHISAERK